MRRTALLLKLLVTPALVSILLLIPVRIAYAQEESQTDSTEEEFQAGSTEEQFEFQTERVWFEVLKLLVGNNVLTIIIGCGTIAWVANATFKNDSKKKELEDLRKRMEKLESTMRSNRKKE